MHTLPHVTRSFQHCTNINLELSLRGASMNLEWSVILTLIAGKKKNHKRSCEVLPVRSRSGRIGLRGLTVSIFTRRSQHCFHWPVKKQEECRLHVNTWHTSRAAYLWVCRHAEKELLGLIIKCILLCHMSSDPFNTALTIIHLCADINL